MRVSDVELHQSKAEGRKMKPWIYIFWMSIFFSACAYRVEKSVEEPSTATSGTKLEFSSVQSLIFRPNCVACHGQYENYSDVKRDLPGILDSVNSNRMPKSGGPLAASLKELLQRWSEAGAPEFAGIAPTEPQPILLEPNWSSISQRILGPKCLLCHQPNGQAKFLDLSSREAIWNHRNGLVPGAPKLLDFENPEQSYLFEVIRDPTGPMPPISSRLPAITDEELAVLIEWVRRGIP